MFKKRQENLIIDKISKENAINCAASAYLTYKLDTSYLSYETIVTEMHNSGASMGIKNHSKEFAHHFLPYIYKVLQQELTNFDIQNDLPFDLIADKMTLNHQTWHIIDVKVPIFDIKIDNLFESIYLEHQWIDNSTGEGLCNDFFKILEKIVFNRPFVRKNLVGIGVDGQYVKCGIKKHLKSILVRDDLVTWDPMHHLELCLKHAALPKIMKDLFDRIQDSMKEFNYGKNFEILSNSAEKFSDFFTNPNCSKLWNL